MLYAGVRPAEGRALRWRDIVPLLDHPEVSVINIYRIRNRAGHISKLPKTDNAFRRIPVHSELAQLLKTRLDYIKIKNPKHSDNDPICCFENNFSCPCKDFQAALKADEIFSQINISTEEMYGYALECALEQLNNSKKTNDVCRHLTLYALRRNFWTWLESLSGLADMEKRYVMGHEMIKDRKDIRKTYNDENLLYEIYQKMTRSIISFERHEELMTVKVDSSHPVCDQNAGIRKIVIPEELLRKGGTLTIFAVTTEPGDALILASKRALPRRETTVNEIPATHQWTRINCGFEEWLAHRKRNRALKR